MFDYSLDFSSKRIIGQQNTPTIQELVANDFDEQGLKYSKDGKILIQSKRKCEDIFIKEGVEIICEKVFIKNTLIKSVHLPSSLRMIGDAAFNKCTNLSSIVFQSNLEYIGEYCFNSTSLVEVDLSMTRLPYINRGAFGYCKKMISVELPKNLIGILDRSFYKSSVLEFHLPDSVEYIGESALDTFKLQHINLPQNLRTIYSSSIGGKRDLTIDDAKGSFKYEKGFIYLNEKATLYRTLSDYFTSNKESIVIPSEVQRIMPYCFGCVNKIIFSTQNKIESIGEFAFANSFAEAICLPETVKSIESYAFQNCNMETFLLPNNLKRIDSHAFAKCKNLKTIYIPNSVDAIGEEIFENCNALEEILVEQNSKNKFVALIPEYKTMIKELSNNSIIYQELKYRNLPKQHLSQDEDVVLQFPTVFDIGGQEGKFRLSRLKYVGIDYNTFDVYATVCGSYDGLTSISIALYDKNNIIRSAKLVCCLDKDTMMKKFRKIYCRVKSRIPLLEISKVRFYNGFYCRKKF